MAKIQIFGSRGFNTTSAQTHQFMIGGQCSSNNANEAIAQRTMRSAGTFSQLYTNVLANSTTGNSNWAFRVDGSTGNQSQTIGSGTTGEFEDPDSDAVSAGQNVNFQLTTASGGSGVTLGNTSILFDATTNTVTLLSMSVTGNLTGNGTVTYMPIAGIGNGGNSTETNVQYKSKIAGTAKNLFVNCTSARTTNTSVRLRINAGNGSGMLATCTASTTGKYEDTSNTQAVSVNDLIDYQITHGVGSGTFAAFVLSCEFETTDTGWPIVNAAGGTPDAFGTNVTQYWYVGGGIVYDVEVNGAILVTRGETNVAFTWSKLAIFVLSNASGPSATWRSRVNGSNGGQTVSISAGTTGYNEDASGSDTLSANDEICTQMVTGSSGSATFLPSQIASLGYITPPAAGGRTTKNTQARNFGMELGTNLWAN